MPAGTVGQRKRRCRLQQLSQASRDTALEHSAIESPFTALRGILETVPDCIILDTPLGIITPWAFVSLGASQSQSTCYFLSRLLLSTGVAHSLQLKLANAANSGSHTSEKQLFMKNGDVSLG